MSVSNGNIKTGESVKLTEEDRKDAARIWEDAEAMLRLVDIIFGFEPDKYPPS